MEPCCEPNWHWDKEWWSGRNEWVQPRVTHSVTDKWGHQLSHWRWVTLQQNKQHNEIWRALCETLSLQYTAQFCVIITMYWYSLNDEPESIALQSATDENHHTLFIHLWSTLSFQPPFILFIHLFHSFSPLSVTTVFIEGCPKWLIFLEKTCWCIIMKQNVY